MGFHNSEPDYGSENWFGGGYSEKESAESKAWTQKEKDAHKAKYPHVSDWTCVGYDQMAGISRGMDNVARWVIANTVKKQLIKFDDGIILQTEFQRTADGPEIIVIKRKDPDVISFVRFVLGTESVKEFDAKLGMMPTEVLLSYKEQFESEVSKLEVNY